MKERLKEFEMTCPSCGHIFRGEFNTAVFSDTVEREAILKNDFGEVVCPACNHKFILNYRFVYTDDERKYMIINDPKFVDSSSRLALVSSFKLLDTVRKNEAKKFRRVMTADIKDLREKILIFEAGLNDKVVEIMKYILLESDDLVIDHDDVKDFTYDGLDSFIIKTNSGDVMNLPFVREVYDRIDESYSKYFDEKVDLVDKAWAYNFLKNLG